MIKNKVIVQGSSILSLNDTSLEQSLATWAGLDKFICELSTVPSIDDDSLVGDVVGEYGINSAVEDESVVIELLHTSCTGQVGAQLVVELRDKGRGDSLETEGIAVLELEHRIRLINWLLNADMLL